MAPTEEKKTVINFSCNLDIDTEMDPFEAAAGEIGIDKTVYFRKMLAYELKHKTVYKKLKI